MSQAEHGLVAGVPVPAWAPDRWPDWFAPDPQPFVVDGLSDVDRSRLLPVDHGRRPGGEVRDSFRIYDDRPRVWLTEAEFARLDRRLRTVLVRHQADVHELVGRVGRAPAAVRDAVESQAGGRRFVWWPSLLTFAALTPIIELIEAGVPASRHDEVPGRVWEQASAVLPGAAALAGTLPDRSGPNCFGTVMAAAGESGAEREWIQQKAFQRWVADHTRPGGRDEDPGTVLLWYDAGDVPVHAAITLGERWALNKPSQAWLSPRFVWSTRQVVGQSRRPGCRLRRRVLKH